MKHVRCIKINLSLCCMSDKEVEKIQSEMWHSVIDIDGALIFTPCTRQS